MGQEETSKKGDKKVVTTAEKWRDPNRHCKHHDVNGHMEENCWKIHLELHPKWLKSMMQEHCSQSNKGDAVEDS